MKKNHINFAHPNKWSDSLASPLEPPPVATEIAMRRRTKKNCKNRVWSRHHSYYRKLWKTMKREQGLRKTRFWVRESVTRGEGISTPTTSVLRRYL